LRQSVLRSTRVIQYPPAPGQDTSPIARSHSACCNYRYPVLFADAVAVLEDTNRIEEIDVRFVYNEERIQVIGMAHGKVLFVIVTLPGEDTCRIISARKATRHEQDRYYAGNHKIW
jgi:uncharacterized protein